MKSSPELREKMWELCYDLLPEGERSALIAQIKSDPHAARLYAEVRLQADLVGYAATVEDPSLNLTADAEKLKNAELAPGAGRRKEAAQPAALGTAKSSGKSLLAANVLAMAAGLALVLLIGVGLFRPGGTAQVAQLYVTEVEVPGQLTTGVTSKVAVRTASPANQPVSVPVHVRLVDSAGNVNFHKIVATPADGRANVELPGAAILPGTRLQVEARGEEVREETSFPEQQVAQQNEQARTDATRRLVTNVVETDLPVSQPDPVTYYVTDKPVADEDGGVRVTCLALDPFRLVPQSPPLDDLEVKEEEITRRVRPEWRVKENLAEATIPGVSAEGLERAPALAKQILDEQKLVEQKPAEKAQSLNQRKMLQVERAKDVVQSLADRGEVELRMAGGEGGAEAAGQNRYRAEGDRADEVRGGAALAGESAALNRGVRAANAPDAPVPTAPAPAAAGPAAAGPDAGAPAAPAPAIVAAGDESGKQKEVDKSAIANRDAAKEVVEKLGGQQQGLSQPGLAQQSIQKQDSLAPMADAQELVKRQRQLVEAGQPVELELSLEQAKTRLNATVESRGVKFAQQHVQPTVERYLKDGQTFAERVTVTLNVPPEVDGNFDVTLTDPAENSVVVRHKLYRAPARELRFEALNYKDRYDLGELVQLKVKVVNEHGEPAASALVARVWNEDFVADDRSQLVMLEDAVRKVESPDEKAGEGEVLAQFGRPSWAADRALAPRASGSGEADEAAQNQLAQSDIRAAVAELKKAEELATGAPAASTAGATASPAPAASTPTPPPSASAPAGPASGPRLAPADGSLVEALSATPEAALDGLGAATESAQTYALAPDQYFAAQVPALTVSNEAAISRELALLKSEQDRAAAAWRTTFGRVLIASGLVALAILGLLFVMRQEVRWSSGTLALVASAASLVIGAVWITGGRQETIVAMAPGGGVEAAGAAIDSATPAPTEAMPKAASPANVKGMLAENMQEIAPAPAVDDYSAPAPPKEATGDLAAVPPAAGVPPAAAPSAPPGGEGKAAERSLEWLSPSKPATGVDPATGADLAAKRERLFADNLAADDKQADNKLANDKQSAAKAAMPPATGAGGAGGRGGFGGGQADGNKDPAGLGGRPGGAPTQPPPATTDLAADRPDATRRANMRAGGVAGQEAAAGTSPAPQPSDPDAAAPKSGASASRNFARALEGEKLKAQDPAIAPSAIYFNPQLATGEGGVVTIEFQLPPVASEYRVLLDAYGNGRVGSSADVKIVCRPAE